MMASLDKRKNENTNRFEIAHLLPGLFFAMTLFVFAPLELYCSNTNEFWFCYSSILPVLIIASVSVIVVTYLINSLLPHKISIIVQALMLTITILLYIQGNYLTINHGTLNGAEIEWGEYTVRYVLDTIAWITIVCLVMVVFKILPNTDGTMLRKYRTIRRHIPRGTCFAVLAVPFPTSAACRILDLPPGLVSPFSLKRPKGV